ncbi:MAG: hypothetical protein ACT4O3_05735, partial [Elusimicrobiota bacterium]
MNLQTGKRLAAFSLAAIYFFVNVAGAHAAEAGFWAERRRAVEKMKSPSTARALPLLEADKAARSGLTAEQHRLIAQLPRAANLNFTITEGLPPSVVSSAKTPQARPPAGPAKDSAAWLSTLVLPYGSLRDVHLSATAGAPLVIHIQDAHGLEDAQRNMARMIRGLRETRGVSLVGLEGAQGGFALEPYRAFPDADINRGIADYFLREGYIGGAEFEGLTAPAPPLLWGTEDLSLYERNIQAFKDSLKNKPAVHEALTALRTAADAAKEKIYSPALQEFDRRFSAYKEGRDGLGAYARYLMDARAGRGGALGNLHLLLNALEWEESLDFKAVERERLQLVEELAKTLSEPELNRLVQRSLDHRLGRLTYGDYYRFLRELCRANGVRLDAFRQVDAYITYVLLAEKINRNELLVELARAEEAAQDALAAAPAQKRLAAASRALLLLDKLAGHAMTMPDWTYYETRRKEILAVGAELQALHPAAAGAPAAGLAELIKPFEEFCLYAVRRNNALVENLLAKMKTEKTRSAILVAGGFHTDGLTQVLRGKDVSYVVITPKINEVPKDNKALDVLARDPLPLEKLLAGEKIFLLSPRGTAIAPAGEPGARARNTMENLAVGLQTALGLEKIDSAVADQIIQEVERLGQDLTGADVDVQPDEKLSRAGYQVARVSITPTGAKKPVVYLIASATEDKKHLLDTQGPSREDLVLEGDINTAAEGEEVQRTAFRVYRHRSLAQSFTLPFRGLGRTLAALAGKTRAAGKGSLKFVEALVYMVL